jgi:hypothetical protein
MDKRISATELVEQIEREYRVCNMDRDKFWDAFVRELGKTKDEDGNVPSVEFSARLWSAIVQGYLKPKNG